MNTSVPCGSGINGRLRNRDAHAAIDRSCHYTCATAVSAAHGIALAGEDYRGRGYAGHNPQGRLPWFGIHSLRAA